MILELNTIVRNQKKLSRNFFKLLGGLRETKGQDREVLNYIRQSLNINHEQIIQLLMEKAHIHQLKAMSIRDSQTDLRMIKPELNNMEASIELIKKYIQLNHQPEWLSRYYRYLGRFKDFKALLIINNNPIGARKLLAEATTSYKLAVKYLQNDPDYLKYPSRIYEYQAFMVHDSFFLSGTKKAWQKSKELFKKMQTEKLATDLKKQDYYTWAVWISGISIRAIQNLITLHQYHLYQKEAKLWLRETEKILIFPDNKTTWADKDFSFRKAEINKINHELH